MNVLSTTNEEPAIECVECIDPKRFSQGSPSMIRMYPTYDDRLEVTSGPTNESDGNSCAVAPLHCPGGKLAHYDDKRPTKTSGTVTIAIVLFPGTACSRL